jgi:nitroreductase
VVVRDDAPAPVAEPATDAAGVKTLAAAEIRRWWHKLSGTALGRERRYVRRGIRAYKRSMDAGTAVHLLRRNVHRVEKGLTMRPARNQFATEYIGETVEAFRDGLSSGALQPERPEFNWMYSVLDRYFSVTAESNHRATTQSHSIFREAIATIDPVTPENGPHLAVPLTPTVKIEDLEALASGRRSVRWFTSEPVSRDLVDRAVAIAAESPTACNRPPYRFEIFDDPVSTSKVAAIPMGTDGYEHQIPGLIVIVGNLGAFFDQRDRHLIYIDGCLAAMGLIYGLEAQGVNSCCINWPDMPEREVQMRRLLGLEPYERVVMLIAYGYADPDAFVPYSAKRVVDEVRRFGSL